MRDAPMRDCSPPIEGATNWNVKQDSPRGNIHFVQFAASKMHQEYQV